MKRTYVFIVYFGSDPLGGYSYVLDRWPTLEEIEALRDRDGAPEYMHPRIARLPLAAGP